MEKLTVGLGDRGYQIWIGSGILPHLADGLRHADFPRRLAIVTNSTVKGLYEDIVYSSLSEKGFVPEFITIPDGEEFKNLHTLQTIYDALIHNNFDRTCGLLALGGGVIGDITGFAAATFLRGVPFAQVPTTLLSQVDSSVGGKTGINHPLGKNLIGSFLQPRHVHIDVNTLRTLPAREFSAGMAEVIKYGVIRDCAFFAWLRSEMQSLKDLHPEALIAAVMRSCQIKADIVELDERETSIRAILNFGHTFGHAVELLSGYGQVKHGEAVAVGMVIAASISAELKLCHPDDVAAVRDLLSGFHLPTVPPSFPLTDYLRAMGRDKKVSKGMLRLVLNRGIGDCIIQEIADPEVLFRLALRSLLRVTNGNF